MEVEKMKQFIRGSRKKLLQQSQKHIEILFEVFKLNHQADGITKPDYTKEMVEVCSFYSINPANNTAIFYTIVGIAARIEIIAQIKRRTSFKKFKNNYVKKVKSLNPRGNTWRVYESCNSSPVTYDNSVISKAMLNGLIPDIDLNCGECTDPTYKNIFLLNQFRAKLNGEEIELLFHEIVQYITGAILPFKTAKSFTIKSSWINQEHCRETPATLYLVRLTKQNGERFYKIGITKGAMLNRLRQIPYDSKVIRKHSCNLLSAIWYEHELHKMNKPYSYAPKISFSGEEECYHKVSKDSFREVLGHA